MPRIGTPALTPGSMLRSKSSPQRRPCSLMISLKVTVPFTDHMPALIFSIAALTSASGFSRPAAADLFCGLAKPAGAFANRKIGVIAQIQLMLAGMIFFIFVLIPAVADDDDGRVFSGPIHRSAITDRGTAFARIPRFWLAAAVPRFALVVTPLLNIRAPKFDIGTIRCLRTVGNIDVAIFGEREKRRLAGKRNWRCIVWR